MIVNVIGARGESVVYFFEQLVLKASLPFSVLQSQVLLYTKVRSDPDTMTLLRANERIKSCSG